MSVTDQPLENNHRSAAGFDRGQRAAVPGAPCCHGDSLGVPGAHGSLKLMIIRG
jgi:hypothetical protein